MELPETPTAADADVPAPRTLHHHSFFPFMAQLFNKGQMTDLKELQSFYVVSVNTDVDECL